MTLQLEVRYKPIDSSINCTRIYNVHVRVSSCLTLSSFSSYFLRYNVLFRVLLGIRRAQMALQHTWYLQMNKRQRASGLLWQLRVHMSFLIDNLQYYVQVMVSLPLPPSISLCLCLSLSLFLPPSLQVDVLDAQFSQLVSKINSTHDFESIKHAHEVYLNTLLTQLFTRLQPVRKNISFVIINIFYKQIFLIFYVTTGLSRS